MNTTTTPINNPKYLGHTRSISLKENNLDFLHFMDTYKHYVKSTDLVLEVGGSTLNRTNMLSQFCSKLISVEYFSERMHDNFKNVEYKQGDWQRLSDVIPENSIDVVVSSHVIEHIQDDLAAINETYKILKPGGIAIINTPNKARLIRRFIELFTGPRVFPFGEHFREYTRVELQLLLDKSSFKKFEIIPVAFGIYGLYPFALKACPEIFKDLSIFHELVLFK